MPQITFPHGEAHRAVDEFLSNDAEQVMSDGRRYTRNIETPDGRDIAAVIISYGEYTQLCSDSHAWHEHLQPRDGGLPSGYTPYVHAPKADDDRLLPTEPLHDPLAHSIYRKPYAELTAKEQDVVTSTAIHVLLSVRLDADDTGAVPILMLTRAAETRDEPEQRMLWTIAYQTDVHGLYLRARDHALLGRSWSIVTGGGYSIASNLDSREAAALCCATLARVFPQVNWMTDEPTRLTRAAKEAAAKVIKRYLAFYFPDADPTEPEPILNATTPAPTS